MSKHAVAAGNIAGLCEWLAQLKEKAHARTGRDYQIITIQEAGLDGFWIHRVLQSECIESHVVDPASILTSRRRRRAKTDKIDGEMLRSGICGGALERRIIPPLRQSQTTGGLRRFGADAVAKRVYRSRAGCVQGWQPAAANHDDPARLAMAAQSAGLGAEPLVPRPGQAQRRAVEEDNHRRARAQAAHRPLEICIPWRRHRRCSHEGLSAKEATILQIPRT